MLHEFISAFITLFVVLDPPGCASGGPPPQATAIRAETAAIRNVLILSSSQSRENIIGRALD